MADKPVVFIGGGPGGYVGAIRLAQLGQPVVVVERERVGGVCLNWGCIPAKTLLHAAGIARGAVEARRMGLTFAPPAIDVQALMGYKGRIVDRLVRGIEFLFRSNGVELRRGTGRLAGPGRVAVTDESGEAELEASAIVIATGSKPAALPGLEPDGRTVIDSNGVFRLTSIPARVTVIGAGVIGLEFATVLARLGAKVTVLELLEQALPGTDLEVVTPLLKALQSEGVDVRLGVRVGRVEREPQVRVSYTGPDGEATVETDLVLVATGRVPLVDGLGLEPAGVKLDGRGRVAVDERYRTSARDVYAIGDVVPGPQLAHRAMADGIALAEVLAGGRQWKFRAVPTVVYTDPEVAAVGMSEAEARAAGRNVLVGRVPLTAVGRSLTLGRSDGLCKLVVDADTDKVLGAAIVGPEADALIAEATVAVELGLTARQLGRVVHAHPTMSELLFEAAEAVHGRAVHVVNR
jgi:dihydrolipoamide dehydrogenase